MTAETAATGDLWVRPQDDGTRRVGLTRDAVDRLGGEITFVGVAPAGAHVGAGEPLVEVESAKASVDVPSPFRCQVIAANPLLLDIPQMLSDDPEGEGWIADLRPTGE